MIITIDPYYDVNFYNETLQALKNNNVKFKEYISNKPPYHFYIETDADPSFINYDAVNPSYSRWLVNLTRPLTADAEFNLLRRDSFVNFKGIERYAINDALESAEKTKEGVFFYSNKTEIIEISKEYPRKIYYMGRHFNNRYKLFFTDSLLINNFVNEEQILVKGSNFKSVTDLEVELNYKVFHEQDRLEKVSQTPFLLNGRLNTVALVPEISNKYSLS